MVRRLPAGIGGLSGEIGEATEITRNSARVSAFVRLRGEGTVTSCHFVCDTTEALTGGWRVEADTSQGNVGAMLDNLTAGTEYHYCLEASNGYSVARSATATFRTEPNTRPMKKNIDTTGNLSMIPMIGRAHSTIPIIPARPNWRRYIKFFLISLKKLLTDEISWSYIPRIIAIDPPDTPGTIIVAPTTKPFIKTLIENMGKIYH